MKLTRRQLRKLISESFNTQIDTSVKWPTSLARYEKMYGVKIAYLEGPHSGKNWFTLYHPDFPGGVMECVSPENEKHKGKLSDPTDREERFYFYDYLVCLVSAKKDYGITHILSIEDYYDDFHQLSFNSDGGEALRIERLIRLEDRAGEFTQYHQPDQPDFDDEWI
jgi:hypothetical protein